MDANNEIVLDMRNIVLKSSFGAMSNDLNSLNVAHINPGSLVANFSEFKHIVKDVPLHLIAISETWFKDKHKDASFELRGYDLVRVDRIDRNKTVGGGVALYIAKSVNYKTLNNYSLGSSTDILCIEVSNSVGDKLLVGVVYNPPEIKIVNKKVKQFLSGVTAGYKDILILGDLNVNVNSNNKYVRNFKDLLASTNFHIASYEDTNFSGESSSCLDLLLTNNPEKLIFFTQISVPGLFTTHDLIYGSYFFNLDSFVPETIIFRRALSKIDQRKLLSDAGLVPWFQTTLLVDLNDKVNLFNSLLIKLLDKHSPVRKIVVKPAPIDFHFDHNILKHRNLRDYLYEVWKSNKNSTNWNNYKIYRNKVKGMIKKAKFQFFKSRIFNVDLPNDLLWKNFKKFGLSKGKVKPNVNFTPNEYCDHFSMSQSTVVGAGFDISSILTSDEKFYFHNVSENDVYLAVRNIHSNSIGSDGIPMSVVRLLGPIVIVALADIINTALTKSIFPKAWKTAYVTPIEKKAKPTTLNDFRPISILPSLSKILENIMKGQIIKHITSCGLLNPLQSGFREKHSTTSTLIKIIDDLSKAVSEGKISLLVLLDFAKAFDSVNHDVLINKLLTQFRFSYSAAHLIVSYLSDRTQIVKVENNFSDPANLICGVPQGSILGPLLFSMFINDIVDNCPVKYHLFADDLQVYDSALYSEANLCVENVNRALNRILSWSQDNHIKINPIKSKAMFITPNKSRLAMLNSLNVVIDNHNIELVDKTRNLGLIINNKISWEDHVNHICCKVYATLSSLSTHSSYLPQAAKFKLIHSLITPHLLYCAPIYSGCSATSFQKLKVAFNSCARFIYNKKRSDSISNYSRKIFNCDLGNYLDFTTVLFLYKIILHQCPRYLYDIIQFVKSPRSSNIVVPFHFKSMPRQASFFIRAIKLWNNLDPSIQRISSLKLFKSQCFSSFSCQTF